MLALENVAPPTLAETVPPGLVDQPLELGAAPPPEAAVFGIG